MKCDTLCSRKQDLVTWAKTLQASSIIYYCHNTITSVTFRCKIKFSSQNQFLIIATPGWCPSKPVCCAREGPEVTEEWGRSSRHPLRVKIPRWKLWWPSNGKKSFAASVREGHQGLARSFSCCCYSLFAFYLESETLVTFYLESESSFVSTLSVNSGSYSQFLKRAVSRK